MAKLAAELTYIDGKFARDVVVEFDDVSGRFTGVSRGAVGVVTNLNGRALLPGFVNVHSHAFQRLIRGRTQWRPANAPPGDFWSWREAMYAAVLSMDTDALYKVARLCFLEMLSAGYTSVGEFHYLQRAPDGEAYDNPLELHTAILAAAQEVGIRIVLINTAYVMGGVKMPLRPLQRRFNTPRLDRFLADCDELHSRLTDATTATMAVAPHSVRAVPREWLKPIHDWAVHNHRPLHMHVSEQQAEVDACVSAYGKRPIELLLDEGLLDERFTAIHATHTGIQEIAHIARAQATVCACPTTERDLGDGFLPASSLHAASARIAIGTDSQTVIDPFEEIRSIEYHERLRRNERVIMSELTEGRLTIASTLLRYGTQAGAHALQLDAGEIADGKLADFIAVDLNHLQLAGWTNDTLAPMLVLSANPSVVTDVWVNGRKVISGGAHGQREQVQNDYARLAAK